MSARTAGTCCRAPAATERLPAAALRAKRALSARQRSPLRSALMLFAVAVGGAAPARSVEAALPSTPVTRSQETFSSLGQGLWDRDEAGFAAAGLLRTRLEALSNLDLDHGVGPSGQPLFPSPLADGSDPLLTHADMRLRLDLAAFAPRGLVTVRGRLDVLDNLALGGAPAGPPTASIGQRPPAAPLTLRRLWAEALLPFGVLAAGRMGSHWGLGLLTHGGDCHDCDRGDAADRVALAVPALGLVWAIAYDFTAIGPTQPRPNGSATLDLDPADDVRTWTFAAIHALGPEIRARRHGAGRTTLEGGVFASHRRQALDVPRHWLEQEGVVAADSTPLDPGQVVQRDATATAFDLWLRLQRRTLRVEVEAAVLSGRIGQASLLPGVELRDPVESLQWAVALESRYGVELDGLSLGVDGGAASGDPAPGFGVRQPIAGATPLPGDLDGAQASPPRDRRLDNFRLHPDARIDRLLFREIIGTVTDAAWVRPHLRWARTWHGGDTCVVADFAAVASWALQPNSTPSGARRLGVELDPTLSLTLRGLLIEWQTALLLPGAAFDNAFTGATAQTAWMSRLFLGFAF